MPLCPLHAAAKDKIILYLGILEEVDHCTSQEARLPGTSTVRRQTSIGSHLVN